MVERRELSPELGVLIHEVDVPTPAGPMSCWVVVSEGLEALAHPELVFPLRRSAPSFEPLVEVIGAIASAARAGHSVTTGGVTRFGSPVLGFDGVFYARPTPIGALHVPHSRLLGLFATHAELDAVEAFGARRVLSRFADATRVYPYPPFTDPERARVSFDGPSVLADMPRIGIPGARVTHADDTIHLTLDRKQAHALQNALSQAPPHVPLTLLMHEVARDADACLTWQPGQTEAAAVSRGQSASRIGGCFLAFANEQPAERGQIVEDGFAYFVRNEIWAKLRDAWAAGRDLHVPSAPGELDLRVSWDEVDVPEALRERVSLAHVQLLREAQGIEAHAMAAYFKQIHESARQRLPSDAEAYEVLLTVMLEPGTRPQFQFQARPKPPPQEAASAWHEALCAIEPPPVASSFHAQLYFAIASS